MLSEYLWVVVVGGLLCFALGFGMGANDVANNFGTSVGSKAISLKGAIIIAAIFELVGAVAFGSSVTDSVRKGVFDPEKFGTMPDYLLMANLTALLAGTMWLLIASRMGLAVSSTHALVGALLGPGIVMGNGTVQWGFVGRVVISWVVAPMISMIFGGLVFALLRFLIFRSKAGVDRTFKFLPLLIWILGTVCALFFVFSNPLVLDGTMCTQKEHGAIVYKKPCKVDHWVEANIGKAFGVGIGVGTALAMIIAPFIYWHAKRSLRKFDTGTHKLDFDDYETKNMSVSQEPFRDASESACRSPEGTAAGISPIKSTRSEMSSPLPDLEREVTKSAISGANNEERLSRREKFKRSLPWKVDLHETAFASSSKAREMTELAEKFDFRVEKVFGALQIVSAAMACLVHGSNDVANATAPFASVFSIYEQGKFEKSISVPIWILFLGGSAISVGLMIWGHRVMRAVGIELIYVSSCRGFCVELSMAIILIIASFQGLPISSTHVAVGAMIGVGLMDTYFNEYSTRLPKKWGFNLRGVNWKLCSKISISWVATIVVSALVSAGVFSFAVYSPTRVHDRFTPCSSMPEGCRR